jgi:ATP-dependent Clp protease ATP-binding subunit ClpA
VELQLHAVAERLGALRISIVLTDAARSFLARESASAGSGARYVARTIARLVTNPLSSAILTGEIREGGTASVDIRDDATLMVTAA